jgi:hypothetical protein
MNLDWHADLSEASSIWVEDNTGNRWVWQKEKKIETYDPADRVGGPYHISALVDEGSGEHLYIFAVVDSYFPLHDLVRANSWEEAYDIYLDWAAAHRHIAIDKEDLKDYKEDELSFTSNGIPVDTDNINGHEVTLVGIDGASGEGMLDWRPLP